MLPTITESGIRKTDITMVGINGASGEKLSTGCAINTEEMLVPDLAIR